MAREDLADAETHDVAAKTRATRSKGKSSTIELPTSLEPTRRSKRKSDAVAPILDSTFADKAKLSVEDEVLEPQSKRSRGFSAGSYRNGTDRSKSSFELTQNSSQANTLIDSEAQNAFSNESSLSNLVPNNSATLEAVANNQVLSDKRKPGRPRKQTSSLEAQPNVDVEVTRDDDDIVSRSSRKTRTLSSTSAAGISGRRTSLRSKIDDDNTQSFASVLPEQSTAQDDLPIAAKTRRKSGASAITPSSESRRLRGRRLSEHTTLPDEGLPNIASSNGESQESAVDESSLVDAYSHGSSGIDVEAALIKSYKRNTTAEKVIQPANDGESNASQDADGSQSTKDSRLPSADLGLDSPAVSKMLTCDVIDIDATEDEQPIPRKRGRPSGRGRGGKKALVTIRHTPSGITKRRGGPGRKKQSDNYMLQSAYERQHDLKVAYSKVARVIRAANERLAEICLERMRDDPTYHIQQPEHKQVVEGLASIINHVQNKHRRVFKLKSEFLANQKALDNDYAQRQLHYALKDVRERHILKAKAAILGVLRDSKIKNRVGTDDESVLRDDQPFLNIKWLPEESEDRLETPFGDEILPKTKASGRKGRPAKKSSPKKPQDALETPTKNPSDNIVEDGEYEKPHQARPSIFGKILQDETPIHSAAATPEPQPNMKVDGDEYGLLIPNRIRRGRMQIPNNRIVVKPWFVFDEGDIGLRSTYAKDGGHAQPDTFHFDPYGPNYRLSDYKVGDFDPEMIKAYGLHPKYGIPIPGACNPDDFVPATDFSKPLPRPRPITFMRPRPGGIGGMEQIETSRSAILLNTESEWQLLEDELEMKKHLQAAGEYDDTLAELHAAEESAQDKAMAELSIGTILKAAKVSDDTTATTKINNILLPEEGSTTRARAQASRFSKLQQEAQSQTAESSQSRGVGALDALADAAEKVTKQAPRRSPAPSRYLHPQPIGGGGYMQGGYLPPSYQSPQTQAHPSQQRAIYPASTSIMSQPSLPSPQGILGQHAPPMVPKARSQQGTVSQPNSMGHQHLMSSSGIQHGFMGPPLQQQAPFGDMRRPSMQLFAPAPAHPPTLFYSHPAPPPSRSTRGSGSGLRDILPRPEAHFYNNLAPLPPYNPRFPPPPPGGYGGRNGYYGNRGQ